MEARKVQRVGQSTLAVSLPKGWTKEMRLKQGDIVFLTCQQDKSLRLLPSHIAERESAPRIHVIDADECKESKMLERVIVGNYVLGHDTIWIESSKRLRSSHVDEARGMTSKLMGLAIMEETPNRILLQCSIDPSKFPIHTLVRRLHIIASTIHKEAVQALVGRKYELARDAMQREKEADTLYWLIVRLLLSSQRNTSIAERIGVSDPRQIIGHRTIATRLERIADWGETIAKDVVEIGNLETEVEDSLIEALARISDLASEVCANAMRCLYAGDIRLANKAIETYETEVEVEEEELVKTFVAGELERRICPYLRRIAFSIRRIAELGAEISEVSINMALEKSSRICKMQSSEETEASRGGS